MLIEDGSVKRCDLRLRNKYIGIKTEIYKIGDNNYAIYCNDYRGNFSELRKDFDYSIRQIGMRISLVNILPSKFQNKIDNISFDNVVDGFKASCIILTDLQTFITSKFHDIDIVSISTPKLGLDFEILICVAEDTSDADIKNMHQFLLDTDVGTDSIVIQCVDENACNAERIEPSNSDIAASFKVQHLELFKELPFTIVEADNWFESAEKIYQGELTRDFLPYFRADSTKCFLDFSVFNGINLRNALLLYDTVYIALPIENFLSDFLTLQGITKHELIELLDMGKVVLLLPNMETRYDRTIVMDAYKCNPNSVVGRRGINTLLASYLCETKKRYQERFPDIYEIASQLFMMGKKDNNVDIQNFARTIAWPIISVNESFDILHHASPTNIGAFGANQPLINLWASKIDDEKKRDIYEFELTVNAQNSHIAAALNATYFPFQQLNTDGNVYSDSVVSNMMCDFLKVFWYNPESISKFELLYDGNQAEQNSLKLFDCKENISVLKVAELSEKHQTHKVFRDLLLKLEDMDEAKRRAETRKINDILFDVSKTTRESQGGAVDFFLSSANFLPFPYALSVFLGAVGIIKEKADEHEFVAKNAELKVIEKLMKDSGLSGTAFKAEDIYCLDKISRVATLK